MLLQPIIDHPDQASTWLVRFNDIIVPAMAADQPTEKQKMLRGELYYAFTLELNADRDRCARACRRFNAATDEPRRRQLELWHE